METHTNKSPKIIFNQTNEVSQKSTAYPRNFKMNNGNRDFIPTGFGHSSGLPLQIQDDWETIHLVVDCTPDTCVFIKITPAV